MLDTNQIIKYFKANKINATVIDDLEDEIQLELATSVAHYYCLNSLLWRLH